MASRSMDGRWRNLAMRQTRNGWGRLEACTLTDEDKAIMNRGSDLAVCLRDDMCISNNMDEDLMAFRAGVDVHPAPTGLTTEDLQILHANA